MKISSAYVAAKKDLYVVRESVLYSTTDTVDCKLNGKLAAIIVKNPSDKTCGDIESSKSTVVILPEGVHSSVLLPLIINRWKSGGVCDYRRLYIGCHFHVLSHQDENIQTSSPSMLCATLDRLDLCYQAGPKNKCSFRLVSLEDGSHSLEYDPSMSLLQAFSIVERLETERETNLLFGGHDGHTVTVLVDSGSSHNIIKPCLVSLLHLPFDSQPSFPVMIGNGTFLHCTGQCPNIDLRLSNTPFSISPYVFPIEGADVVLGMSWLSALGLVKADFSVPQLTFNHLDQQVTLRGESSPKSGTIIDLEDKMQIGLAILLLDDRLQVTVSFLATIYSPAKRQPTLSRSSAEAEYRGAANAVAETCWLRNLLCELHTPLSSATLVYCDNVSAVYLSSNPVQHQRTKHIEIDIHFVRDLVATGQVRVLHVPSRHQFADIFISLSVRCPPAQTAREC
ncbi:ribonuclease H-like domain-containing protein [Tanacetum coccineum]